MSALPRSLRPVVLLALLPAIAGCTGRARETTTERAAEEVLLVRTAAERAVRRYDASELAGRRVAVETAYLDAGADEPFLVSAMREHLGEAGARVVEASTEEAPEVVLEIRRATLAINDPQFVVGIPPLPVGLLGFSDVTLLTPDLSFGIDPQRAWAKIQLWLYEADTRAYLGEQTLWAKAETGWFADIWPQSDLEAAMEMLQGEEDGEDDGSDESDRND